MDIQGQIDAYLAGQAEPKRADMQALHSLMLRLAPGARLWFLDGRNSDGKVVSNPNIGYGLHAMTYADGKTRDFYKIGISANTTGISVYVMGIEDKTYLAKTYGDRLGKASITGYCVKFRRLSDIDIDALEDMLRSETGSTGDD